MSFFPFFAFPTEPRPSSLIWYRLPLPLLFWQPPAGSSWVVDLPVCGCHGMSGLFRRSAGFLALPGWDSDWREDGELEEVLSVVGGWQSEPEACWLAEGPMGLREGWRCPEVCVRVV